MLSTHQMQGMNCVRISNFWICQFFNWWTAGFLVDYYFKKFLFLAVPLEIAANRCLFLWRHLFINSLFLFRRCVSFAYKIIVFSRLQRLHFPTSGQYVEAPATFCHCKSKSNLFSFTFQICLESAVLLSYIL